MLNFHNSVEYLGHVINKEGIHPVENKVEIILPAKPLKNTEQLLEHPSKPWQTVHLRLGYTRRFCCMQHVACDISYHVS